MTQKFTTRETIAASIHVSLAHPFRRCLNSRKYTVYLPVLSGVRFTSSSKITAARTQCESKNSISFASHINELEAKSQQVRENRLRRAASATACYNYRIIGQWDISSNFNQPAKHFQTHRATSIRFLQISPTAPTRQCKCRKKFVARA